MTREDLGLEVADWDDTLMFSKRITRAQVPAKLQKQNSEKQAPYEHLQLLDIIVKLYIKRIHLSLSLCFIFTEEGLER